MDRQHRLCSQEQDALLSRLSLSVENSQSGVPQLCNRSVQRARAALQWIQRLTEPIQIIQGHHIVVPDPNDLGLQAINITTCPLVCLGSALDHLLLV